MNDGIAAWLCSTESIRQKFVASAVGAVLISLALVGFTGARVLRDQLIERAYHDMQVKTGFLTALMAQFGEASVKDGRLFLGAVPVDGSDALVDRFAGLLDGASLAIYRDDVRVAATPRPDGTRPVGMKVNPGLGRDAVFGRGEGSIGLRTVDGETRVTSLSTYQERAWRGEVGGARRLRAGARRLQARIDEVMWACAPVAALGAVDLGPLGITVFAQRLTRQARNPDRADDAYRGRRAQRDGRGAAASRRDRGAGAALEVFRQRLIERNRLVADSAEAATDNEERRKRELAAMADGFDARGPAASSPKSRRPPPPWRRRRGRCRARRSRPSARPARRTTPRRRRAPGVRTAAVAAEHLTNSIHEISRQVAQSAQISGQAVTDARRTDAIVRALADGAEKIGHVVGLISDIAGQTNLLALNATIEAARAGDAGRASPSSPPR